MNHTTMPRIAFMVELYRNHVLGSCFSCLVDSRALRVMHGESRMWYYTLTFIKCQKTGTKISKKLKKKW